MNVQEKYATQIAWLMEGDPAIRYQTLRDLLFASENVRNKERVKILKEGWGRRFMDLQEEDGTWSHALYAPKWTSTFYTLFVLKRIGAPTDKNIERACRILLDKGFYEKDGGINYWKTWKQGECCVTAMLVSMLCYFQIDDERLRRMVDCILAEQMADTGWNCERGAKHSSFHTTISVLEGLWEYEQILPTSTLKKRIQNKQDEGIEFLLSHHLYKSNTTWEMIDPKMIRLSFPPYWHFDILRCFDYFQERNIKKDDRMMDAMEIILKKQTTEGFWKREINYPAKVFFDMEKVGKKGRWNTLRVLRILQWWENQ